MKIKRLLALVLATVMIISVLSACTLGKGKASVYADIDEDGRFIYSVLRSAEASSTVEDAAKDIRANLKKNFECTITITKDNAYEDFDGNFEILVGDTTREASATARQILKDNRSNNASDFIVAVIGDKIVITAMTDAMVGVAAKWFVETFCQSLETWALLKEDYQFIYAPEKQGASNNVNGTDLGMFTVVRPHQMSYMAGLCAEEFIDYYANQGYEINYIEDKEDAAEYEILIGDTTRAESKTVTVDDDNYIVKVVGKKIVIKGGSILATWRGAKAFLDAIYEADKTNTPLNWTDGHTINGRYDETEAGAYTLNFNDEFESSTVNKEMWVDYYHDAATLSEESCLGGKVYHLNTKGETAYKGEESVPKLIYQSDGKLNLGAARVGDNDFIGSYISTFWSMIFKYGCLEISAKLAPSPASNDFMVYGAGTDGNEFKERFGQCSRSAYSEMDLLQNAGSVSSFTSNVQRWWKEYGADGSYTGQGHNAISALAAYAGSSENNVKYTYDTKANGDDLSKGFHTYTFYWDNTGMKFAFDGKTYLNYEYLDNMSVSLHCLANYLALDTYMGSAASGKVYNRENDPVLAETQIDYIRIYQTAELNSQMVYGWPDQQSGTRRVVYPEKAVGEYY